MQRDVHRRRPFQMHVKIRGHGARRPIGTRCLHQMHRRGPVAVAIEQRATDAAVENAVEGLMMRLRPPLAHDLLSLGEAPDAQPFVIWRTAAEAAVVRCIRFLNAFHLFANAISSGKKSWKRRSSCTRES